MAAAMGFAIHTGWAAAVVVEGPPAKIAKRMRIDLADGTHDSRFVYHVASERPSEAEQIIGAAARTAVERARASLGALSGATILAVPPPKRTLPGSPRFSALTH